MATKIKSGIFIFLFAVLWLPMLQNTFPFINSGRLYGEFTITPDTVYQWQKWIDGSYQSAKTKYINDNIGFRPDLLRLTNQLDYSLFNKIHSAWKLFVDHSSIVQDVYVDSYLGTDFIGYPAILEKVRKMKAIQDTLQKQGKTFIFALSPGKSFYYPEYLPAPYKNKPKSTTNFETYKRISDSVGLNVIDFNSWFMAMKNTSKELLYTKAGCHWSQYGALIAADSLTKYIEHRRGIHMVHPTWNKIIHTNEPKYDDDDLAKTINLIYPLANETYSYPVVKYEEDKTTTKPNIILIGDSFLYQWLGAEVVQHTYNNWHVWYYNHTLIDKKYDRSVGCSLKDYNRDSVINSTDCVVIMFTTRNLGDVGMNFVEQTYSRYYPGK